MPTSKLQQVTTTTRLRRQETAWWKAFRLAAWLWIRPWTTTRPHKQQNSKRGEIGRTKRTFTSQNIKNKSKCLPQNSMCAQTKKSRCAQLSPHTCDVLRQDCFCPHLKNNKNTQEVGPSPTCLHQSQRAQTSLPTIPKKAGLQTWNARQHCHNWQEQRYEVISDSSPRPPTHWKTF